MAQYQDNNILFTNVTRASFPTTGRISKGSYTIINNNITQTAGPVLNAIDIDWNGAYLSSIDTYINTTGQLLAQINSIYESLNNLSNINLSDYLKESDITLEFLNNILGNTYASKSVESSIEELSNALSNKANSSDIPTSIYQLNGYDNLATISWVNTQLRTYSRSAYDVYKEQQESQGKPVLTKDEWLNSLNGANGLSAYEIARQYNPGLYYVTEYEWIQSLKGEPGQNGEDGKSAYELAVENGFEGTKEEWIQSLKGEPGQKGEKGDTGPSINILGYFNTIEELKTATSETINSIGDAYNINGIIYVYNDEYISIDDKWKSAGQFKGEQGEQGKSAYEIYCEIQDSIGQPALERDEWLQSLKGEQGEQGIQGKSAYEIYCEVQQLADQEPLSREEWLESIGAIKYTAGNRINISENNVISVINRQINDVWVNIE